MPADTHVSSNLIPSPFHADKTWVYAVADGSSMMLPALLCHVLHVIRVKNRWISLGPVGEHRSANHLHAANGIAGGCQWKGLAFGRAGSTYPQAMSLASLEVLGHGPRRQFENICLPADRCDSKPYHAHIGGARLCA